MPRSELILVRVTELEPGQRVRMPRTPRHRLQTVVSVEAGELGAVLVHTDIGAYVCDRSDMVDVEEMSETDGGRWL